MRLDLQTIRSIAESYGFSETDHNATEEAIIFESDTQEPDLSAAVISVWYGVGTVGVAIGHPRQGRVQSFHFDIDVSQLPKIFCEPGQNKSYGYSPVARITASSDVETNESTAIKKQILTLDLEMTDLAAERKALNRRLNDMFTKSTGGGGAADLEIRKKQLAEEIETLRKQKTQSEAELSDLLKLKVTALRGLQDGDAPVSIFNKLRQSQSYHSSASGVEDAALQPSGKKLEDDSSHNTFLAQKSVMLSRTFSTLDRDTPSRARGNRCTYSFVAEAHQDAFGKAWSAKPVNHVSLGRGYVILYDDGGIAWWDIPEALDTRLRDDKEANASGIKHVALGAEGNYFIKFVNGKMEWVAKDSFANAIKTGVKERHLYVEKVNLGENGAWLIIWSDGSIQWENIPADMAKMLTERDKTLPGVKELSFGSSGEWFVLFKDHAVQASNLSDSMYKILADLKSQGGRVRQIVFGEAGNWYIRYWDGS